MPGQRSESSLSGFNSRLAIGSGSILVDICWPVDSCSSGAGGLLQESTVALLLILHSLMFDVQAAGIC